MLVVAIEQEFELKFTAEDIQNWENVGAMADYISNHVEVGDTWSHEWVINKKLYKDFWQYQMTKILCYSSSYAKSKGFKINYPWEYFIMLYLIFYRRITTH